MSGGGAAQAEELLGPPNLLARPPARPPALAVAKVYKGLEGGLTVLNGQGVTADRAEAMRRLEEDESTGWNPDQPMESALKSRRLDRPLARKRVRRMVELFRRIVRDHHQLGKLFLMASEATVADQHEFVELSIVSADRQPDPAAARAGPPRVTPDPTSLGRSEQAALLEALPEEPCRAVNFADAAKMEGGLVAVLRGRNLGEEVEGGATAGGGEVDLGSNRFGEFGYGSGGGGGDGGGGDGGGGDGGGGDGGGGDGGGRDSDGDGDGDNIGARGERGGGPTARPPTSRGPTDTSGQMERGVDDQDRLRARLVLRSRTSEPSGGNPKKLSFLASTNSTRYFLMWVVRRAAGGGVSGWAPLACVVAPSLPTPTDQVPAREPDRQRRPGVGTQLQSPRPPRQAGEKACCDQCYM